MRDFCSMFKSVVAVMIVLSAVNTAYAYPSATDLDGTYNFSATLTLENESYGEYLFDNYDFTITTDKGVTIISDFIIPAIYTSYDETAGILTLTTNYGKIGSGYLGFADADASWTGMGTMYGTLLDWQIGEDGSITIPDFTIVDYSSYNSDKTVTVVARYSDCSVTPSERKDDDNPGDGESITFEGRYAFDVTQTEFFYTENDNGEKILSETKVTPNYTLNFAINEYNQIWAFDGYSLSDEQINTIRNRGIIGENSFKIDMDTYNGVEWIYVSGEEYTTPEAKLFGSSSIEDWEQGITAFTLTKNSDNTYSLTDFTLWQRTMEEIEDENGIAQPVRVLRPIKKWENICFSDFTAAIAGLEIEADATPRYFNLQGAEVRNPSHGLYIRVEGSKAIKVRL